MVSRSTAFRVLISQRVDMIQSRDERRDAIDQSWYDSLSELLERPVITYPLPNDPSMVEEILSAWRPSLIVLSGGNDFGEAPERDKTEQVLLEYAREFTLPVLAVCRGMQLVQIFFGGQLKRVSGHVGHSHLVFADNDFQFGGPTEMRVNSYHNFSFSKESIAPSLVSLYTDSQGWVEAAAHCSLPWVCLMWHPERNKESIIEANRWLRNYLRVIL